MGHEAERAVWGPRSGRRRALRPIRFDGALLAAGLLAAAPPLPARQVTDAASPPRATAPADSASARVAALVDQVAGSTIYLRAGSEAGLGEGDTVSAARDSVSAPVGRLAVLAVSAGRSVTTFAGTPFPVTRGETLYLETAPRVSGAPPAPVAGSLRPAPAAAAASAAASLPAGPEASGRVAMELDLRHSATTFGGADPVTVSRNFATPALWLQTRVTRLPGGLQLDANARIEQRASDVTPIDPRTSTRIYEASLSRRFESVPFDFRLGRFFSPYDPFGGYWDGLMLHYGRTVGGGVSVGYEPDRFNQAPQSTLPKASAFLDVEATGRTDYRGAVSITALRPRGGPADHSFLGLSQQLRAGSWYVSQALQLDRALAGRGWIVSRAELWASGPLTDRLDGRVGLSRSQPFDYWATDSVLSYRRDQVTGGLSLRLPRGTIGGDVAVNRDQGLGTGRSYSGYLTLTRLTPAAIDVSTTVAWWTRSGTRALLVSPRFSRWFGSVSARLGYQLYRTESTSGPLLSHGIDLGLGIPLGGGLRYDVSGGTRFGGGLGEIRLYTSLSKSF